ncbi:unnamed protein product [Vitrella brassicaformis CCMP3155]|uniref:Major facilitator superfamily (MFS) profile domain-containing protein n=2 Tax=Vitrella brassicaformis TaxID=1169539 RepID=A0A0G4EPS8_VITBC|nr:unnamed protein product [Vitrella brassicaformis CCMP3155]|eukprot:CEL99571.1 unnamed protein product [Vitrella brassicaformis CCMP3155]
MPKVPAGMVDKAGGYAAEGDDDKSDLKRVRGWSVITAGFCLELIGAGLSFPVLPYFALQDLGGKATHLGMMAGFFSLSQAVGAGVFGALSDAIGRKPLILNAFVIAGCGWLLTSLAPSINWLIAARGLAGISGGSIPFMQAITCDMSVATDRASMLALVGASVGLATIIGPAAAALLEAYLGLNRRLILAASGGFGLTAFLIGYWFFVESHPQERRRRQQSLYNNNSNKTLAPYDDAEAAIPLCGGRGAWEGISCVGVSLCCLGKLLTMLCFAVMPATYPALLRDSFGFGDIELGLILFFGGVVGAMTQLCVLTHLMHIAGPHGLVVIGATLLGFGLALEPPLAAALGFQAHLMAVLAFSVGVAILLPGFANLVSLYSTEAHQGWAQGILNSSRACALILGYMCAGVLYDKLGPTWPYLLGGVMALCGGAAAYAAHLLATPVVAIESIEKKSSKGVATVARRVMKAHGLCRC